MPLRPRPAAAVPRACAKPAAQLAACAPPARCCARWPLLERCGAAAAAPVAGSSSGACCCGCCGCCAAAVLRLLLLRLLLRLPLLHLCCGSTRSCSSATAALVLRLAGRLPASAGCAGPVVARLTACRAGRLYRRLARRLVAMGRELREISLGELARHDRAGDCWVAVEGHVLDVSTFAELHPGGAALLVAAGGRDVSQEFFGLHRRSVLDKYLARLQVGMLAGSAVAARGGAALPQAAPAAFPFADYLERDRFSPYFNESHRRFRAAVRAFIDEHVAAVAEECEQGDKPVPAALHRKIGAAGLYAAWVGPKPGQHLRMVDALPGGLRPEELDYHHEAIVHHEFARVMCPGFEDGLVGGRNISVPVLLWFASREVQDAIVPPILRGEKHSALAITEPGAGTDVQGLQTTATKSPCGRYWIVCGAKKWISQSPGLR